jgi:hypothetical protein
MHAPPSAGESLRNSLNTETFKTLLSAPRFARGFSPEPYPRRAFEHGVGIALFRAPAARKNQRPTGPTWAIRRISTLTGYAASRHIQVDPSRSESIRVECIRSGRPYPGHRVAEAHTAAVGRQDGDGGEAQLEFDLRMVCCSPARPSRSESIRVDPSRVSQCNWWRFDLRRACCQPRPAHPSRPVSESRSQLTRPA